MSWAFCTNVVDQNLPRQYNADEGRFDQVNFIDKIQILKPGDQSGGAVV